MKTNFQIASIPQGLRFFQAHDSNMMLFGILSMGIRRDALRMSYLPDLAAHVAEAAAGREVEPRFYKSAAEAAEFMAGLIIAEIGEERLREIAAEHAEEPEFFAPFSIEAPERKWLGEECLQLAFEYASGGRALIIDESAEDNQFAVDLWEAFTAAHMTRESVAA